MAATPLKLCEEYLDVHEGIQSEIISTTRFDENSDLSTAYLGRVDKEGNIKLKVEESFPISKHGYTSGKTVRQNRVSIIARHKCKQVIYV